MKVLNNLSVKKNGFTLAEVLITLVIIGVIAAITIPTVTANHRREEVETRLKKFYTALYNAHQFERMDGNSLYDTVEANIPGNGNKILNWFKENIIEKHLSVAIKFQNGVEHCYNDGSCSRFTSSNSNAFYTCIDLVYDINGERGPNKAGRDQFAITFCEGAEQPYINLSQKYYGSDVGMMTGKGVTATSLHEKAMENCKKGSDSYGTSLGCFYLIKNNGFKLPEDYPHKI